MSDGHSRKLKPSTTECRYGIAEGACPHCGASPFYVAGDGKRIADRDHYEAQGYCAAEECWDKVGTIIAKVSTIFGLEDDEDLYREAARLGIKVY
jgi:hypothetical protein